jgi:hypothetical protein
VRDNEEKRPRSRDLTELGNYDAFLRRTIPRFVRSALETRVNNEIQPIEERLRGQILDVIVQAQKQASLEYRAMIDTNHGAEALDDPGYILNQSRSSSSRDRGEKRPANNLKMDSSILSTAVPADASISSQAILSQFIAIDSIANSEGTAYMQPSFANPHFSGSHHLIQGNLSNDTSPFEGDSITNPTMFTTQPWDPNSDFMDMNSFHWG